MRGSWISVDAGLVVRLVLDPHDEAVLALFRQWQREGRSLAAPARLPFDVTAALHRYRQQGVLSGAAVRLALQAALALPIRLHDTPTLHNDALLWWERFPLPSLAAAYDLALAETLEATLWSGDPRLLAAVGAALPWVRGPGE